MPAIRTLQLTFIVGADTARTLPAWREPAELLELADLAVAARAGDGAARRCSRAVDAALAAAIARAAATARGRRELPGDARDRRLLLDGARARARAASRSRIWWAPAVAGYIAEHGLYRDAERRPRS